MYFFIFLPSIQIKKLVQIIILEILLMPNRCTRLRRLPPLCDEVVKPRFVADVSHASDMDPG